MARKNKSKKNVSESQRTDRMLVNQFKQAIQEKDLKKAESAFDRIEKAERKRLKSELQQLKNEVQQDIKHAEKQARLAFDETQEAIDILAQGASHEPLEIGQILHTLDHESDILASKVNKTRGTQLDREAEKLNKLRQQLIQARSVLGQRQQEYDRMMVVPKKAKVNLPWKAIFSVVGFLAVLLLVFLGGAILFGRHSGNFDFSYKPQKPIIQTVEVVNTVEVVETVEVVKTVEVVVTVEAEKTIEETVEEEIPTAGGSALITMVQDDGILAAPPAKLELCYEQELDLIIAFDSGQEFEMINIGQDGDCFRYKWEITPEEPIIINDEEPHMLSVIDKNNDEHILLKKKFRIDPNMLVVEFPKSGEPLPVFPWFAEARSNQELEVDLVVKRIDPLQAPVTISLGDQTFDFEYALELIVPKVNMHTNEEEVEETVFSYTFQWNRGINDFNGLPDGRYYLIFTINGDPKNEVYHYFELNRESYSQDKYLALVDALPYDGAQSINMRVEPIHDADTIKSIINGNSVTVLGYLKYLNDDNSILHRYLVDDEWCLFDFQDEDRGWIWCELLKFQDPAMSLEGMPEIAPPISSSLYETGGVIGVEAEE